MADLCPTATRGYVAQGKPAEHERYLNVACRLLVLPDCHEILVMLSEPYADVSTNQECAS